MIPRRIPDYPDAFAGWNYVSSCGSLISVVATMVFIYIIYDILCNGSETTNNPFSIPAFYQNSCEFYLEPSTSTFLEWTVLSPTPFHSFIMLPMHTTSEAETQNL